VGEDRDRYHYQRGYHVCTPTEAVSEQDVESGHVHSARCSQNNQRSTAYKQVWEQARVSAEGAVDASRASRQGSRHVGRAGS